MIGRLLVAAVALMVPQMALAKPINLECTVAPNELEMLWKFALDEETGTAVITSARTDKYAYVKKVPAVFTADMVLFENFKISRTDLKFDGGWTRTGYCRVVKERARAF